MIILVVKLGNECVSPQNISLLLNSTFKVIFPLIWKAKNKNRNKKTKAEPVSRVLISYPHSFLLIKSLDLSEPLIDGDVVSICPI